MLLVSGQLVLGVVQVFASFAGGAIATYMGWRWIFIFSIIFAILVCFLLKDTPESKQESTGKFKFDYTGLAIFIVTMIALNLFITLRSGFGLDKCTFNRLVV